MRHIVLVVVMLGLLVLAAAIGAYMWWQLGDVEMSRAGIVALIAGVVATVGLGAGLMWLVFYSHKRGYDDEVR
ncbi:MAG: hypothetical protein GY791_15660 [Alphaproteobacteria bacterium]|nr:hypothetical protein [Alphaproteobacteria bacterium]